MSKRSSRKPEKLIECNDATPPGSRGKAILQKKGVFIDDAVFFVGATVRVEVPGSEVRTGYAAGAYVSDTGQVMVHVKYKDGANLYEDLEHVSHDFGDLD